MKVFHKQNAFLPLATLKDLDDLEHKKGFFCGATNILFCTTPTIKPDLVIDLDSSKFDYRGTELCSVAKKHTVSDKRVFTDLVKQISKMDHGVLKKDQYCWDSIPMGDGAMVHTVDQVDNYIRGVV